MAGAGQRRRMSARVILRLPSMHFQRNGRRSMGFLKKLFEKKDCEICGGEIGLLGNTKPADGDMFKDYKKKLG